MPPPDGKYIASWMMLFIEILDTWIAGLFGPTCKHFIGIHGFMANLYVGIL